MATITRRKSGWYVQVRRLGYAPQSRTFPTKGEARAWANQQEALIDQQQTLPDLRSLRKVRLGELLERYVREVTPSKRSAESESLRLGRLIRSPIANVTLADLTSQQLAAYRDERLQAGIKPGTIRRELSLVSHALETARHEWGYSFGQNPVKLVRQPAVNNARNRRLREGELERLEQAMERGRNPLIRPIVLFAIETGMRRGEILNLTWQHVELAEGMAHIPHTKTGKPRTIPLTPAARQLLLAQPRGDERVFRMSPNAVRLAWERLCKRAMVDNLHFHDLRHEAISRFFELGLSVPEVALISGHRDPRMLFRYTHLRPHELAQKLNRMGVATGRHCP